MIYDKYSLHLLFEKINDKNTEKRSRLWFLLRMLSIGKSLSSSDIVFTTFLLCSLSILHYNQWSRNMSKIGGGPWYVILLFLGLLGYFLEYPWQVTISQMHHSCLLLIQIIIFINIIGGGRAPPTVQYWGGQGPPGPPGSYSPWVHTKHLEASHVGLNINIVQST